MVTEALLVGAGYYLYSTRESRAIKSRWRDIVDSIDLYNGLGQTFKLWKIETKEYGYDLFVELPYGVTSDKFKKSIDIFKEGLGLQDIIVKPKDNMCILNCVTQTIYKEYEPIGLPPNKIYITQGLHGPIIVNMNELPGILIAGTTNSGKTRVLLVIMTNLICSSKRLEIFLIQAMKQDLKIYEDCEQVKAMVTELIDILKLLKELYQEAKARAELIDTKQGYYNIEDYNNAHEPNQRLKYRYVVIEEFSFLNISKGDSKEEKAIKQECIKYIEGIAKAGRSSGVFLICCLQRPTDDSIPSQIKNVLNTDIAFKLKSTQESQVIITAPDAVNLGKREMLISSDSLVKATSLTIDHKTVMKYIQPSIIEKQPKKIETPKQIKRRSKFFESNGA